MTYLCMVRGCSFLAEAVLPYAGGLFHVCTLHDADQVRALLDAGSAFMACYVGPCRVVLPCEGQFSPKRRVWSLEQPSTGYSGSIRSQTHQDDAGAAVPVHAAFDLSQPFEPPESAWMRLRRRR